MTDQTKAPELPPKVVIWERVDFESGGHRPRGWTSSFAASLHPHHYVRADLAAEQVREVREAILDAIASIPHPDDLGEAEGLEKAYRAAEVAADMSAESVRSIKAMVNEAYERAAEKAKEGKGEK